MGTSSEKPNEALKDMAKREGKYLTFFLANEEYGIGILKVKEIIGMMSITPIPRTPDFVKGVINLRGKVIPVIDLRLRFEMESVDYTERTCIIVVEIAATGGTVLVGIVVNSKFDRLLASRLVVGFASVGRQQPAIVMQGKPRLGIGRP